MLDTLKQDFLRLPEVLGLPLGEGDTDDRDDAHEAAGLEDREAPSGAARRPARRAAGARASGAATPAPSVADDPAQAGDDRSVARPTSLPPAPPAPGGPAEQLGLF